jgi:ABC-type uncharacterized transport system substrate-binding protein
MVLLPESMQVQRLTKTKMVINLKTAKALGLAVPPGVDRKSPRSGQTDPKGDLGG